MQNKNTTNRPVTVFFLSLKPGMRPRLFDGVNTQVGIFGPAIVLPEVPDVDFLKCAIRLNKHKPAIVKNGKIYNAIFKGCGGNGEFSDPATIMTLVEPSADDKRLFIIAPKRWDFENKLGAAGIPVEVHTGRPNGSVAPGLMILNPGKDETPGDSVKFTHGGKSYILANANGSWNLLDVKPTPVVKVKPVAPEVVIDKRMKITEDLKVVGKVELNNRKEVVKPTPVVEATKPPVKKTEVKAKFYKKGAGNNGNHHVPLAKGQTLPEYIPATTGLGELLANALQKNEAVVKTKKVTAVKAEVKKATTKRRTTSAKTKAVA